MKKKKVKPDIQNELSQFKMSSLKNYSEYLDLLDRKYEEAIKEGYEESEGLDPMVMCKFIHKNIMKDLYRTGKCTGYRKRLYAYVKGLDRAQRLLFRDKLAESTSYKNSVQSINYIIKDLDIKEGTIAPKREYSWSKVRCREKND